MNVQTTKLTFPQMLGLLSDYNNESLESLLVNLCSVGMPTLHRMERGWWVTLKMHVAAAGTEFKVQSESDCATPTLAARQCAERALATLQQWAS